MFETHALGTFTRVLIAVLDEYGVDEEETEVKLIFERSEDIFGRGFLSLENYDQDELFIGEPKVWLQMVQRVFSKLSSCQTEILKLVLYNEMAHVRKTPNFGY